MICTVGASWLSAFAYIQRTRRRVFDKYNSVVRFASDHPLINMETWLVSKTRQSKVFHVRILAPLASRHVKGFTRDGCQEFESWFFTDRTCWPKENWIQQTRCTGFPGWPPGLWPKRRGTGSSKRIVQVFQDHQWFMAERGTNWIKQTRCTCFPGRPPMVYGRKEEELDPANVLYGFPMAKPLYRFSHGQKRRNWIQQTCCTVFPWPKEERRLE